MDPHDKNPTFQQVGVGFLVSKACKIELLKLFEEGGSIPRSKVRINEIDLDDENTELVPRAINPSLDKKIAPAIYKRTKKEVIDLPKSHAYQNLTVEELNAELSKRKKSGKLSKFATSWKKTSKDS